MMKKIIIALCSAAILSGCSSSGNKKVVVESRYENEFEKAVGDKVFFKFDSAEISNEAQNTLSNQAKWLNEAGREKINIIVEGHCDERGTREYNIALGEKRAEAVKNTLIKDGVGTHRIETISYGKERPAVVGTDEEAYSKNRRGVTVLK